MISERASLKEAERRLLAQYPIGTRVRVATRRLAGNSLSPSVGTVARGHFDGWYVALDAQKPGKAPKTVLILRSDTIESLGDAEAAC